MYHLVCEVLIPVIARRVCAYILTDAPPNDKIWDPSQLDYSTPYDLVDYAFMFGMGGQFVHSNDAALLFEKFEHKGLPAIATYGTLEDLRKYWRYSYPLIREIMFINACGSRDYAMPKIRQIYKYLSDTQRHAERMPFPPSHAERMPFPPSHAERMPFPPYRMENIFLYAYRLAVLADHPESLGRLKYLEAISGGFLASEGNQRDLVRDLCRRCDGVHPKRSMTILGEEFPTLRRRSLLMWVYRRMKGYARVKFAAFVDLGLDLFEKSLKDTVLTGDDLQKIVGVIVSSAHPQTLQKLKFLDEKRIDWALALKRAIASSGPNFVENMEYAQARMGSTKIGWDDDVRYYIFGMPNPLKKIEWLIKNGHLCDGAWRRPYFLSVHDTIEVMEWMYENKNERPGTDEGSLTRLWMTVMAFGDIKYAEWALSKGNKIPNNILTSIMKEDRAFCIKTARWIYEHIEGEPIIDMLQLTNMIAGPFSLAKLHFIVEVNRAAITEHEGRLLLAGILRESRRNHNTLWLLKYIMEKQLCPIPQSISVVGLHNDPPAVLEWLRSTFPCLILVSEG